MLASIDLERLIPLESAVVSPRSPSLHYAQAVFEGMTLVKREGRLSLFHPRENLARMRAGAAALELDMSAFKDEDIIAHVFHLAERNGFHEPGRDDPFVVRGGHRINKYYVRPLLYTESDALRLSAKSQTHLLMAIFPMGEYFPKAREEGLSVLLHPRPRQVPFPTAKAACNYAPSVVARRQMERFNQETGSDCQEVLFADAEGRVVEGCVENIAAIQNREFITPAPAAGVVEGITMKLAARAAEEMGLTVRRGALTARQLAQAESVFLSGNAIGLVPIARIAEVDSAFQLQRWHEMKMDDGCFQDVRREYERMKAGLGKHAALHVYREAGAGEKGDGRSPAGGPGRAAPAGPMATRVGGGGG